MDVRNGLGNAVALVSPHRAEQHWAWSETWLGNRLGNTSRSLHMSIFGVLTSPVGKKNTFPRKCLTSPDYAV